MDRPPSDRPPAESSERIQTRVLVVLDQPAVAELVRLTLHHGRFEIRQVISSSEALVVLGQWRPHLVLLDMDLEGIAGARVMDRIRPAGEARGSIPAIALTRRGDLRTKLEAFERGVDDIMSLPFPPEELLARVIALLRRSYPEVASFAPVIRLGELEIDILHRSVRAGSAQLRLTALEQSLLYLLAANAGRIISREEILAALWGPDYVAESNIVDRQVRNLRARLKDDWRRPRYIATVAGRGYRFLPAARGDKTASTPR
jgi:two-component system KDP operon response regulator KdpE